MFRYLCEDETSVFPEKRFQPAVRKLATNLLLSGEIEDNKEYTCLNIQPSPSSSSCVFVAGELGTYEALSSDLQKNVLSALHRLEAVTKLRAWVTRLGPGQICLVRKLIFCAGLISCLRFWRQRDSGAHSWLLTSSQVGAERIPGERGGRQKDRRRSV